MDTLVSRLDIAHLFCELDDFYQHFEYGWQHQAQLPSMPGERRSQSRLSLSEVMTIAVAFPGSGFRTFKEFYTLVRVAPLATCLSQPGQLQLLCRVDAVVPDALVLLLAHTPRRLHRHRIHRLHPSGRVSSREGTRAQSLQRTGAMG
jgi:hypothetical protein